MSRLPTPPGSCDAPGELDWLRGYGRRDRRSRSACAAAVFPAAAQRRVTATMSLRRRTWAELLTAATALRAGHGQCVRGPPSAGSWYRQVLMEPQKRCPATIRPRQPTSRIRASLCHARVVLPPPSLTCTPGGPDGPSTACDGFVGFVVANMMFRNGLKGPSEPKASGIPASRIMRTCW